MDDKRGAMMRRFPLLMLMMLGLGLGLGAGAARADDNGLIYIGAGISRNKIDNITHTGTPVTDIDKPRGRCWPACGP
jgi:hypothetical protein